MSHTCLTGGRDGGGGGGSSRPAQVWGWGVPLARPGGCLGLEGKAAPGRLDTSTSDSLRPSPQTAIKLHSELSSLKPTLPRPRHPARHAFQNPCTCKSPQLRPVPTVHPPAHRVRGAHTPGLGAHPGEPSTEGPGSSPSPAPRSLPPEHTLAAPQQEMSGTWPGRAGGHGIQVDPPPSRSGLGQGPQSSLIFLLFWV